MHWNAENVVENWNQILTLLTSLTLLKKPGILHELYQEIEYQIKKTKISQQKKEVQIGKDLMNLLKSNLIISNYIF